MNYHFILYANIHLFNNFGIHYLAQRHFDTGEKISIADLQISEQPLQPQLPLERTIEQETDAMFNFNFHQFWFRCFLWELSFCERGRSGKTVERTQVSPVILNLVPTGGSDVSQIQISNS